MLSFSIMLAGDKGIPPNTTNVKETYLCIANNRTGFVLRNGDETYPMSMQYTYDKLNRVSRITSGNILTDYTYNRNGAISSEQIGDVTTSYQYNRAGWITDLTSQTSAKTIQSHHYQYLPDGNISAKESTVNAGTTNYSYLYDNAGRLTQEQIGSRQQAYQYDPYGNRSQMTVMDQESYSTSYTYDQNNRLLYEIKTTTAKSEQTTYQYDDNGNLSSWFKGTLEERAATPVDESASYTYDAYNRLTDFRRNDSNVCHYGYNGDNLRIFKDVNGYIRKKSYWDGSTLAAEIQANVVYKYYHGLTGIMFTKTASVLSGYYYKNAHGDVTAVADDDQNVTQTYTYDAFGNQLSQSNNDTNPFRYCGEYFDTESNQIYLRNRYYDTATGRFITEDPVRDGVNWYGYCDYNPILYTDSYGLDKQLDDYVNAHYAGKKTVTIAIERPVPNSRTVATISASGTLDNGHSFLRIDDGAGNVKYIGIGPAEKSLKEMLLAQNVKGKIINDSRSPWNVARVFELTDSQYNALLKFIWETENTTPEYNIRDYNCTTFAVTGLRRARINIYKIGINEHRWTLPADLETQLKNYSARGNIPVKLATLAVWTMARFFGYTPADAAQDLRDSEGLTLLQYDSTGIKEIHNKTYWSSN